jgi:hypothetical protein
MRGSRGDTALRWAATFGDLGVVKYCAPRCGRKCPGNRGQTPLGWASTFGHDDVADYSREARSGPPPRRGQSPRKKRRRNRPRRLAAGLDARSPAKRPPVGGPRKREPIRFGPAVLQLETDGDFAAGESGRRGMGPPRLGKWSQRGVRPARPRRALRRDRGESRPSPRIRVVEGVRTTTTPSRPARAPQADNAARQDAGAQRVHSSAGGDRRDVGGRRRRVGGGWVWVSVLVRFGRWRIHGTRPAR